MTARLEFHGYLQPPFIPPDPVGDDWRGPAGPPGPPGPVGSVIAIQGTITVTATGTIDPLGLQSVVVTMGSVNTTLTISPGYQGQQLRLEIKQGAAPHTVAFDSTVVFGADVPSFTATATANKRDLVQLLCLDGTHWAMAAINKGFAI